MDVNKTVEELLAQDKGIKKAIRKLVYKACLPLLCKMQVDIESHASREEVDEKLHNYMSSADNRIGSNGERITNLEMNIRNNNDIIKRHEEGIEYIKVKQDGMADYGMDIGEQSKRNEKKLDKLTKAVQTMMENGVAVSAQPGTDAGASVAAGNGNSVNVDNIFEDDTNSYDGIDYFDFENRFRGSDEHIREVQKQYLPYYEGKKNVLDIGCGRGEFLELLKADNINALGIDMYGKSVECCKVKGLNVLEGDALAYLDESEGGFDGIFAGQLVEHLTIEQINRLCRLAYDKLTEGSYMILETPNPTSLAIYTHAFYMDPSHVKPVHPLTLQYCAEKAGFKDVQILYTESSKLPMEIPAIKGEGIEDAEEFNRAMAEVSRTLFGSQDYAIIARK